MAVKNRMRSDDSPLINRREISGEQILALVEELSWQVREFSGERARAAAILAQTNQLQYHQKYFGFIFSCMSMVKDLELHKTVQRIFSEFFETVIANEKFGLHDLPKGTFAVQSNNGIPVLELEPFENFTKGFKADFGPEDGVIAGATLLAIYIRAFRGVLPPFDLANVGPLRTHVEFAIGRIEAVLAIDKFQRANPDGSETETVARVSETGSKLALLEEQSKKAIETLQGIKRDSQIYDGHLNTIRAEIPAIKETISEQIEKLNQDLIGYKKSLREELHLEATRTHWQERANEAWWAFWASTLLLAASMIGLPYSVFHYRDAIVEAVVRYEQMFSNAGTGSLTATLAEIVARLALIAAPIGFLIWMLRLVVRFNMRSMLLMDDARHRLTMLNTYLTLIEKDAAMKEDRGAVLEALFRRAPGHGPDTVEPPNFVDLLKTGQTAGNAVTK